MESGAKNQLSFIGEFTEFTTMAGRRLREAVKETLISSGNGEFSNNTYVVIAGLTNTYSQYIATSEEYEQQRYEVRKTQKDHMLPVKASHFKSTLLPKCDVLL